MDKDQEKMASENHSDAAACGPSPGPGCWAIAILLLKEESNGRRKTVTRRMLVTSAICETKEEAIGDQVVLQLAANPGFSVEHVVAVAVVDRPNPRADRMANEKGERE